MLEKHSKSGGIRTESRDKTMNAATEAPKLIECLVGLRSIGESQKAAFNRAARHVSKFMATGFMSPGRLENIYRGEARRIDADEMDAIREAAKHPRSIEARNDIRELRDRLSRLEAALCVADEAFHGAHAHALGTPAGGSRRVDSAVAKGDR